MQAKYDATKVAKASRKCVDHYAALAQELSGNDKKQALNRMAACKDINVAVVHAVRGRSVMLSTGEFLMLSPCWVDK